MYIIMYTYTREKGNKDMSKMSEIDMMVQEVVEMVETAGMYVVEAVSFVKKEWALDNDETLMVWKEASHRVHG